MYLGIDLHALVSSAARDTLRKASLYNGHCDFVLDSHSVSTSRDAAIALIFGSSETS